jgi:hypothetical protein
VPAALPQPVPVILPPEQAASPVSVKVAPLPDPFATMTPVAAATPAAAVPTTAASPSIMAVAAPNAAPKF